MTTELTKCPKCHSHNYISLTASGELGNHWHCTMCNIDFLEKREKDMYVVIRDPGSVSQNSPAKIYPNIESAIHALEAMAAKNPGQVYYIAKLIKKGSTIPQVNIEDVG